MRNSAANCSDDLLRQLLVADAEQIDVRHAVDHLDSCPRCQERIGELAAGRDEWDRAKRSLWMDEVDRRCTGICDRSVGRDSKRGSASRHRRDGCDDIQFEFVADRG